MRFRLPVCCVLLALGAASAGADAQIVVVGAKSPTIPMNREQVAAAFMGKLAGVEPLDLIEGNPVREDFYAKGIGKSAAQMKSYWAKLSFTGKGTPPREYANSTEVKRALAGNPNAIGYIERTAVDGSVRVVFDGR